MTKVYTEKSCFLAVNFLDDRETLLPVTVTAPVSGSKELAVKPILHS
jgi:hypothetical protein